MRHGLIGFVAALAALSLALPAAAQPAPGPGGTTAGAERAAEVVETLRLANPTPALSVAVARDGAVIWARAWGKADLELGTDATPQTRFRLGSVSKIVTATIAARLAQQGRIDLDAPISRYMPDLPAHHRATTLRQLFGHQGGVRHYIQRDQDPDIDLRDYPTTASALAIFINDPLIAEPRARYAYSTFGYTLAGAVMEAATGKTLPQLIAEEVTTPLDLPGLEPDVPTAIEPMRSRFYSPTDDGGVVNAVAVNSAYKWAGGGMIAAPADLALFGQAILDDGYLTEATRETMFTLQDLSDGSTTIVGLGWRADRDDKGRLRWHHAGNIAGGRALLLIYPELGLSIAIMSNLGGIPSDVLNPSSAIADAFAEAR